MAIEKLDSIKIKQHNIPFTQISTKVIQSIKNAEALAVWVYLSTKPPNWIIQKNEIRKHFGLGENKIDFIFSYLKKANLLAYTRERDEKGKLGPTQVHILCGDVFGTSTPIETMPMVSTTIETRRVENHAPGKHPPYKRKKDTKEIGLQKKEKSFYGNTQKHGFAKSMDQMASETKHIAEHQRIKMAPMPEELREKIKKIKDKK